MGVAGRSRFARLQALLAVVLAAAPLSAAAVARPTTKTARPQVRTGRSAARGVVGGAPPAAVSDALGPSPGPVAAAPTVSLTVVKQAIKRTSIVPFMKTLAMGKSVEVAGASISLADFATVWAAGPKGTHWIEDQFRAVRPHDHEWIPSNYLLRVVQRASSSSEGLAWIDLQDQMRSATKLIIFKPSKIRVVKQVGGKSYLVLQGHVGALDDHTSGDPLTVGTDEFHDQLRAAFDGASTIAECATAIKKVFEEWVWDGQAPDLPISPDVYYHEGGSVAGDAQMIERQKASYAAIAATLDAFITQ
jgi:hypothetical protein